jgi:RHS repeat-associated protein
MGRLYQVAQGSSTTRMGYDGLDRIAEFDSSNAVQRRYIHGPGVDNPIAWYEGSNLSDRRYLSSDERGSIISVTGGTTTLNKYDEYGVPQSTNSGKFGYTGQAWVPEVGLWYYKARFLRPDIGRFLQTDPIAVEGGINLYAYVGNDPINWLDPSGLIRICYTWYATTVQQDGTTGTVKRETCFERGGPLPTEPPDLGPKPAKGGGPTPAKKQQCPAADSTIGQIRKRAAKAADVLGNAGNVTALAGAVPSPLTPILEGAAGLMKGGSIMSSLILLGTDAVYAMQTGNKSMLLGDLANFGVGSLSPGKAFGKVGNLSEATKKVQERLVDTAHGFNTTENLPAPCK